MATGPNRASPPVYEDFRPVSEWHQEAGAEILLIFLPGFMKESIRVSIEGKNTVRAGGELFIGSNTWCRFQEDFQAPDDCNIKRIDVKFEDGILTITVPRKRPRQLLDEQTEQFPHRIPHKDDNIPPTNNHSTDENPRKLPSLQPTTQHAHKDQDSTRNETLGSAESSNTQKGDKFPPRTTYPTTEAAPRKPTPVKPATQQPKHQHAHKDQDSTRNETSGSAESSNTQKGDKFPPRTTYPTTEAAPRKPTPVKPTAQQPKPQHAHKDQDSTRNETSRSAESSNTQKGDNVPSRTTYATTEAAPRKQTPVKPTAQLPKPQHTHKDQDSSRNETSRSAESSNTQKGDNVPSRTTYATTEAAPRKPTPV
uniref:SHSP domain-containing protein n=2 Tax=Solanum lycopersicum TaxID=4081 RepID=A0A3Q7EM12_SOLLC